MRLFLATLSFLFCFCGWQSSFAQTDYNNEIRLNTSGGKQNIGFELQYARVLMKSFAAQATIGYHQFEGEFSDFDCSKIESQTTKFGLGGEWRILGETKGPFIQGNLFLFQYTNNYKVRIPEDGVEDFLCSLSLFNIFGVDVDDFYSLVDKSSAVGFGGRAGYRLVWLKERMTFSPFVSFESSPISNSEIALPSNSTYQPEEIEVNPFPDIKISRLRVGVEIGVRF